MKLKCLSKSKSCCCYSLEHGAIIIGITFMISSSVALLCEIGMLAEWSDIKHNFADKRMRKFVHPFLIVSMVLSAVYIGFSILLLNGIKKAQRHHIWPWIAWSIIYILVAITCAIYELTLGAPNGAIIEVTLVPALYLIVFIFWIYCVYCIWNYFKIMTVKEPFDELDSEIMSFKEASLKRNMKPEWDTPTLWDTPKIRASIWDSPALSKIRKSASIRQNENQFLSTRV